MNTNIDRLMCRDMEHRLISRVISRRKDIINNNKKKCTIVETLHT